MESDVLTEYADSGIEVLNEYEARQVLREYDIPCPREVYVETDEFADGKEFVERLADESEAPTYPLYLKVASRDISSVSDVGGVERVRSPDEIPVAVDGMFDRIESQAPDANVQGILATEDVSADAREILLGSTVDPQFGKVVSLGIGGIYVEVYGDVEFRVVPLTAEDARSMVDGLEGREILDAFRGMPPADLDSLVSVTIRFARMIEANPEIREADVNPLMVGPDGVVAADALIQLS